MIFGLEPWMAHHISYLYCIGPSAYRVNGLCIWLRSRYVSVRISRSFLVSHSQSQRCSLDSSITDSPDRPLEHTAWRCVRILEEMSCAKI